MYNSEIPQDILPSYLSWLSKLPKNQQNTYDYDMIGAFLSGMMPAADGHFRDTFKKPNHPSFSRESQYSNEQSPGGMWTTNGEFIPTKFNLAMKMLQNIQ